MRAEAPGVLGQWLEVEDREGERWRVECLGEPVAAGLRVAFAPLPGGGRGAGKGELLRVLDADPDLWVARLVLPERGGRKPTLIPFAGVEAPAFHLDPRHAKDARDGDRVVLAPLEGGRRARQERTGRGRRHRGAPRDALPVRVVEVLGPAGDPSADHRALAWRHRLPGAFSRRARLEAEAAEERVGAAERRARVDLSDLPFVTIDPATAKDHDDAVFAEEREDEAPLHVVGKPRREQGASWRRRLWVAIADVSHFVPVGGFVDGEARRRGNSFYFPDRAIPMLPERLSNDLCSLRPDVERRAIVVELRLTEDGRVADALFHEALIRSRAKLAYEEAADFLASEAKSAKRGEPEWGPSLRCLERVARDLRRRREAEGAVELELPEVRIVVDETGRAIDAVLRERNPAHGLIEEAMLAANRAVAGALERAGRPAIHRVHPPPAPQRLAALEALLERHGFAPDGELDAPGVLPAMLRAARGAPAEERIHVAALRSMSQARYASESGGHYALRFDHYLHFTSPIRRYADLAVHRALRQLMRGEPAERGGAEDADRAERLALWLSGRERVATEAERDAQALAACAIMAGREGQAFDAAVVSPTEFGLFVRLVRPAVDGLVPMRLLGGRWTFDPDEEVLVEAGGRRRHGAGDTLRVRLVSVDPDRGRLAFRPAGGGSRVADDDEEELGGKEEKTGRAARVRRRRGR